MYHRNKCTPNYIGSDPALKIDMDWTWPETERSCRHCVHGDVNTNGYNPTQPLCLYFKEYNKTHPDLKYDYTRGFETDWNATCRFFMKGENHELEKDAVREFGGEASQSVRITQEARQPPR